MTNSFVTDSFMASRFVADRFVASRFMTNKFMTDSFRRKQYEQPPIRVISSFYVKYHDRRSTSDIPTSLLLFGSNPFRYIKILRRIYNYNFNYISYDQAISNLTFCFLEVE